MGSLAVPKKLISDARAYGINVSGLCRRCIAQEIARIEKEAGVSPSKANPQPADTPQNALVSGVCDV